MSYRTFMLVLAATLAVSCASAPQETTTDIEEGQAEVDDRPDLGEEFPGWCTESTDEGADGTVDRHRRQTVAEDGDPLIRLTDDDGDGIFDEAHLNTYADDSLRWAGHYDRHGDAVMDSRYGRIRDAESELYWLLEPRAINLRGSEPVLDDQGREIGRRDLDPVRGNDTLVSGTVRAHMLDDSARPVASFIFDYRGPEADAPAPARLREGISRDDEAGVWRLAADLPSIKRVHMLSYAGDTRAVLEEVSWFPGEDTEVPTLEMIMERVGHDEPHVLHQRRGYSTPGPSQPDAWGEKLSQLVLREVDDETRIIRYRTYHQRPLFLGDEKPKLTLGKKPQISGGKSRLMLRLAADWSYDDEGRITRMRTDSGSPVGNSTHGVYDKVRISTYKYGEKVEVRTDYPKFPIDVERSRVPMTWRSLEIASAPDESNPIAVEFVVGQRELKEYGKSGNLLEWTTREKRGLHEYVYEDDRLVRMEADGGTPLSRGRATRLNGIKEYVERFEYDERGRKSKKIAVTHTGDGRHSIETTTFTYEDGELAHREIERSGDDYQGPIEPKKVAATDYEYDDEGRLVRRTHENLERRARSYVDTFTYDDQGRRIRRTRTFSSPRRDPLVVKFEYDDAGRLVGEREFEGDALKKRTAHTYDDAGVRTKSTYYKTPRRRDENEPLELWYTAEYEYDDAGRLTVERQLEPPKARTYRYDCYE